MNHSLLKLAQRLAAQSNTEAPLPPDKWTAAILDAPDSQFLSQLSSRLREYEGSVGFRLTGLDLYSAIELSTPMILFHVLPRRGDRNKYRNGVQQSYGDHNRLLVLGIDMLLASDMDWYLSRATIQNGPSAETILDCFTAWTNLNINRKQLTALWIAGALHDYGKLGGREYGLDAEDAVALAQPVLQALCATEAQPLVEFAIRNHDLIEYTLNGETPVTFISKQLAKIPDSTRLLGLAFLGVIQLAGAASLGEGRLEGRKAKIFFDCLSGRILENDDTEGRLVRLIYGEKPVLADDQRAGIRKLLASAPPHWITPTLELLESTVLRGWQQLRLASRPTYATEDQTQLFYLELLKCIASLWQQCNRPDFVVLSNRAIELISTLCEHRRSIEPELDMLKDTMKLHPLLSGASAVVL